MPISGARRRRFQPPSPEASPQQAAAPDGARLLGLHPATWLALWLILLLLVSHSSLLILSVIVPALAIMAAAGTVRALVGLQRVRWVFLSIFLIYGWATPGQPVWPDLDIWSPTSQGVHTGVHQVLRLAAAVITLGLLLERLGMFRLLVGLDWLLRPLRFLGVAPERIAARLWLTLHYAQQMLDYSGKQLLRALHEDASLPENGPQQVTIARARPGWRDAAVLCLALAVLLIASSSCALL